MARTLSMPLFTAVLFSAFIISTFSISPTDLSHLPTGPLCYTPLAGAENTAPAASYIYDATSFFHPNPQRLTVPQQATDKIASNPLLAAVMPYAQQYMSHRTKSTQKSNGVGAALGDGTSNTTVHAWFIIFLVILGGLAWTAHHTVKSAENEERKEKERKEAEQAEKDKFKRSLVVGPLETIDMPIDGDGEIIREDQYEQRDGEVAHYDEGQGNNRYVNPNYYSEHENTYAAAQENGSYYENQEPVVHQNQGNDGYDHGYDQGSSNYDPQRENHYEGHQQNGQYYDDRQALGQYGASQGPSDYDGQAVQYGNYQYDDDQDLANLVDEK